MSQIIEVPFVRAEDQRQRALFAWADHVLHNLGLIERLARAVDFNELRKIVFDPDDGEVDLAIRDALHPTQGSPAWFFDGLRAGGLKRIITMRFNDTKADREKELRRGGAHSPTWADKLKLDDEGWVQPILSNYIVYLVHHPSWLGVLAYDEFSNRVVIRKQPPWGEEVKPDTPLNDHHETQARVWFQCEVDVNPSLGDIGRAVQEAARSNSFHPVRDYLDGLQWDGTSRLDAWLVTYFHVDDSKYVRAIGPRWLISAVARIYKPGCQADHTIVFEGPQGKLKSTALARLAGDEWFTDRLSHVASKDAAIEVAGTWLIEIAEMDALNKAASSTTKSFLTRRFERFRPPHGKLTVRQQRQCVFAGTINPPAGGYLRDPTGARRFWPVFCHGVIDLNGLERDRDQLWAEAMVRYKAGARWWLETQELEALANAEQALRFKTDLWTQPIKRWIGRRRDVSITEVMKGVGISDQSHSAEISIASILKAMAFKKERARKGSKRENRYRRSQP
jgi:predicted P-loop ATPase